MILYMYIAPGQGLITSREQNFYVKRIHLSLWPTDASLKEISLNRDFVHILFIHADSPRAGADHLLGTEF